MTAGKGKQMKNRAAKLSALALTGVLALGLAGCAVTDSGSSLSDSSDAAAEASAEDSLGEPSLVVTSVALCEILDELEYDNVVGIPETSSELPARYDGLTTVGAPMSPDVEIVRSLSPDYAMSPSTLEDSLASEYQTAGISSIFVDLNSVDGMYTAISSLGTLLDREEQAQVLVNEYEEYMESYYTDKEDGPSILLLMAYPDGFYLVVTEDAYVGDLVSLAGGTNVYSDADSDSEGFVSINPEDMVQRDPDMILVYAHYDEEAAFAYMESEFESNDAWSYYEAVQEDEIYYLPSDYFSMSASLDWTESLEYLEDILYGE